MATMGEVKSSPFFHSERPQNGMIRNWLVAPEARFAICDDLFHACQILQDFNLHLLWRQTARKNALRRLPASRKPARRSITSLAKQLAEVQALRDQLRKAEASKGLH